MLSKPDHFLRGVVMLFCIVGLIVVFFFQRLDFASLMVNGLSMNEKFMINKAARYIANDFLMIGLIYALFANRQYVIFAFYVQLAGMLLFLAPYFVLKFYYPSYNGPLISFLHRLIVNPLLMLLLIPAFFYQKSTTLNKP